jgi:TRAP-type C4-dicarboxylate transport system substrate-binding protein
MKLKTLLSVAVATSVLASGAIADTYKWITYKPQGAGDAQAITTQWFADEFAKRTGGKDSIQIFWGGSVAKAKEIPTALSAGVGDFGDVITPYFPDLLPVNNAVGFFIPQPLGTEQVGEAMEAWHAKYPQFSKELAQQNLRAIGFRPLENYGLLCTKPIHSLQEMKGLRIRSYGFAYPALIKAMGATPVSVTTSDAYEALQRNVLDCTPIGPALARGWKYDEVAKYYIEVPFGASFGHIIAMNLDRYNAMDAKTQAVVNKLGHDYLVEYSRKLEEDASRVREAWKGKLGVQVIKFPAKEFAALVANEQVQAVRNEWVKKAQATGLTVDAIVSRLSF